MVMSIVKGMDGFEREVNIVNDNSCKQLSAER
jgi:hypothetical protein